MIQMENAERFDESFATYLEVEAFKALQEARAEIEKVLTEVDYLKKALEVALTLMEEKRKKIEEEVGAEKERAIEAFKSSKAMEDIKIAFTREAFLEGFEICMRRFAKNFADVDLELLTDEPNEEAGAAPESAPKPDVMVNAPTSITVAPLEKLEKRSSSFKEEVGKYGSSSFKEEVGKDGKVGKVGKNCSELTIEVTCLHQVHKKYSIDYINNKCHLIEELEWAKKLSSEKAWTLTAKVSSLEIELKAAQEKI
ncbi:hypothetical protein COCNU_scaffold001137G000010 [Cocos nucifera]|nr:hypothetical protein [Cocos nucifera]